MAYGFWEVSGKFLIPGARKSGSFGPIRVLGQDRQAVSKDLARMLNSQFKRELRGDHRFSDQFALLNLRWIDLSQKTETSKKQAA